MEDLGKHNGDRRPVMDDIDRKLLELLQRDARRPLADLGAAVNLSTNACWRRIKRLEAEGVLRGQVALVDRSAVGRELTVFALITAGEHSEEWLERFSSETQAIPEVIELHRLTGSYDFLVKIVATDIDAYDRVYHKLMRAASMRSITSVISVERIKETTEIPVTPPN